MRSATLALALIGFGSVANATDRFSYEACGLHIAMPSTPKCQDHATDAPIGRIEFHACRATVSTSPVVIYVVGCDDYPADYVKRANNPDGLLRAALQGEVNDSGGTLASLKDIRSGKLAGKEAVIEFAGRRMVERVFIVGRRIFHVGVVAPAESFPVIQPFLDSLQLVSKK